MLAGRQRRARRQEQTTPDRQDKTSMVGVCVCVLRPPPGKPINCSLRVFGLDMRCADQIESSHRVQRHTTVGNNSNIQLKFIERREEGSCRGCRCRCWCYCRHCGGCSGRFSGVGVNFSIPVQRTALALQPTHTHKRRQQVACASMGRFTECYRS